MEKDETNKWKFSIIISDPDKQSIKLKYMVRFFYDKNITGEDYRNSKEGIYDFELDKFEEINKDYHKSQSEPVQQHDPFDLLNMDLNDQKNEG